MGPELEAARDVAHMAQEAYYAEHQTYTGAVSDLGDFFYPTTDVTLRLEQGTVAGWRAGATHAAIEIRCAIFIGDVDPPRHHGKPLQGEPGEPRCWEP